MTKFGKIGFLIAALCFVMVATIRFILGAWIPLLYILLAVAGMALLLSFISDRKLYFEFFTLRTTKHGLNMGALILLVLSLLVCVNYLSVRHNKTWDLTKDQLNSLSDQSQKVLKNLDSDVEIKVFYRGADALGERQNVRQALGVYQENSPHFKVQYIDAYVDNIQAQEYLASLQDRDQPSVFVFVEYKGKKVRVDDPFGEEQVTASLIKVSRRGESKVYFLIGHDERDLKAQNQQGLYAFQEELKSASYITEELNLFDKDRVPEDAALVAIVGPKKPLLENERLVLKKYLENGGRLLLALDPGEQNQLSSFVRLLGVDFKNNYIINLDPLTRQASGTSIGVGFDKVSEITSSLPEGKTLALFDLASALEVDPSKPNEVEVKPLVRTAPTSFAMTELKKQEVSSKEQKSFSVFMSSKGKISQQAQKDYFAVVVGDSDFLTNRLFLVGSNRDLGMNTVAALTNQNDLISIRPRQSQGDKIILTSGAQLGIILAGVSLPVLLLLLSGVFWYQRRGA